MKKRQARRGVERYLGHVVEVHTGTGFFRGTLEDTDSTFLYLCKANGRGILVKRSAITALFDEERPAVTAGPGARLPGAA